MNTNRDFNEVVELIRKEDKRYQSGAYFFMRGALDYTLKKQKPKKKSTVSEKDHVSGQDLVLGIRDFALDQYGPIAKNVLEEWGIARFDDFGEIVFNLVDYGIFGKTGQDSREDFKTDMTFEQAFVKPFLPISQIVDSIIETTKATSTPRKRRKKVDTEDIPKNENSGSDETSINP